MQRSAQICWAPLCLHVFSGSVPLHVAAPPCLSRRGLDFLHGAPASHAHRSGSCQTFLRHSITSATFFG
uniref:Secreted protein n=1 Tax=Equus asinus TaxID=9793 RepID=A0A8C4M5S4_EQUAS